MKKSMFILSVVMVVVMAIALTTSSLAWYYNRDVGATNVTASGITVQAEKVTVAGHLQISASEDSGFANDLTMTAADENYNPTVPLLATGANLAALGAKLKTTFVEGATAKVADVFKTGELNADGTLANVGAGKVNVQQFYLASVNTDQEVAFSLAIEFSYKKVADNGTVVDLTAEEKAALGFTVWCVVVEDETGNVVAIEGSKDGTDLYYGVDGTFADTAAIASAQANIANASLTASDPANLPGVAEGEYRGASKGYHVYMWYDGDALDIVDNALASSTQIGASITATQK